MQFVAKGSNIELLSKFLSDIGVSNVSVDFQLHQDHIPRLLESPYWPEAIDPLLIVSEHDEDGKFRRAQSIVASFVTTNILSGRKFLDFGCGEGHVAKVAAQYASKAIGYDPTANKEEDQNLIITSELDVAYSNGPYDVILLYDVLDHLPNNLEVLNVARLCYDLLTDNGMLIVRSQPFIARHAAHTYTNFNKAYAHLVYSSNELIDRGYDYIHVNKVLTPITFYRKLWENVKLTTISEQIIKRPIEDFFKSPEIINYFVSKHWSGIQEVVNNPTSLHSILSIQFIDYKLVK